MKNKIITILAILVAMTGIVAAEPCPSAGGAYEAHPYVYNDVSFYKTTLGNIETYFLNTANINKPSAGIIELCIYPKTPGFPATGVLTPLYDAEASLIWKISNPTQNDYFGFVRDGGANTIPINGRKDIKAGTADYLTTPPGLLDDGGVLLHIDNPDECNKYDKEKDNTCFRRPGTIPNDIPEFPTVALPIAAVIGLVFFFQNRKKKEE